MRLFNFYLWFLDLRESKKKKKGCLCFISMILKNMIIIVKNTDFGLLLIL
jgi:hypothetical protein